MTKLWGRPPSMDPFQRLRLDEPWHGNVLLSCGPHKLEPNQRLQEFNADFVPRLRYHKFRSYGSCACELVTSCIHCRNFKISASLVAKSACALEESRSGGLKEFSKPER